jgi:glycerate kinase
MRKFVLAPDSFKGTLTSVQVCEILSGAIRAVLPEAEVLSLPVADGGEGSVDTFLTALGGRKVFLPVTGPDGEVVQGFYGALPDGTAVVEMAAAAGLPLTTARNPERTTTFGVGELLLHAAEHGAKKILLCLGGSATNDGGCGAAAACGVRFLNGGGETFTPVGGSLKEIASVEVSGLHPALRRIPIITMCDIDNPLCGESGAAAVFAPQKGADAEMVARLDGGLRCLAGTIRRCLGRDVLEVPGAGAAGGMGAGMTAFFASRLQMGIETVLDTVQFEKKLRGADLVLTGEGKLDEQSLRGKVVVGVARRAKRCGVPVAAVVGDIGDGAEAVYREGVTGIFSINRTAVPYEKARLRAADDLRLTAENLIRYTEAMR